MVVLAKDSEERFRSLFESTRDGIIISNPDGKVLVANQAAAQIIGFKNPENLIGKPMVEFYAEPEQREVLIEKLMTLGSLENVELNMLRKDGKRGQVLASLALHRDEEGKILRIDGIFRDITERRQLEEELRKSEEKYRSFIESSRDGVEVFSGTKLLFASQRAAMLHGCESLEEFVKVGPLECVIPEDREKIRERALARQGGEYVHPIHEFRVRLPDGSIRYLESSSSLLDYGGQEAILTFMRDITERKKLEEERDDAFRKGTIYASKDVRNKIIMAYQAAHLSEQGGLEQEEAFNSVKNNLKAAMDVLDSLLFGLEK